MKIELIKDPFFKVETLSATPNPNTVMYAAMHQDYSSKYVWNEMNHFPTEEKCGEIVVKRLLEGDRGHYGVLEHPQIVLACGYFPHSTMQQVRTHRNVSFDVQSFRYTGDQIVDVAIGDRSVEEVFYLRPAGWYSDRSGNKYEYTQSHRDRHCKICNEAAEEYRIDTRNLGLSEEHARGIIPFDIRQHFVLSGNLRSILHILDLRAKADAQIEIQTLCAMIFEQIKIWVPAIADYYENRRYGKAKLAP